MIAMGFVSMFSTMLFFIWLITPTYKATDRVLIHHNYKQQLGLFNDMATPGIVNPRVNWALNMLEIAKSTAIAEEIVREFGLDRRFEQKVEHPEIPRDVVKAKMTSLAQLPAIALEKLGLVKRKPTDYFAEAVEEFLENAEEIELVEDTEILEIGIYEETPELSGRIAGAISRLLIEKAIQLDRKTAEQAFLYASEQLKNAEQAYLRSQRDLERFKLDWQVTSLDDEKALKLEHLGQMECDLSKVLADLAGKRAELKKIQDRLNSPVITYSEHKELTDRMPGVELSVVSLAGSESQLRENIRTLKEDISLLIQRENEYLRLVKQASLDEEFYTQLLNKKNEFVVQKGTEVGEFSIRLIDSFRASPNADPDWPDPKIFLPFAMLFSLGVAFALAFFVEFFLKYPRYPSELIEMTGIPIWGIISLQPSKRGIK
ncbi:MAG: hypothetical protein SV775_01190 [Thermodesulfobacteriota bacterium]|nr:hypothetical protein [Thermodesulfobacteriota bacterium]